MLGGKRFEVVDPQGSSMHFLLSGFCWETVRGFRGGTRMMIRTWRAGQGVFKSDPMDLMISAVRRGEDRGPVSGADGSGDGAGGKRARCKALPKGSVMKDVMGAGSGTPANRGGSQSWHIIPASIHLNRASERLTRGVAGRLASGGRVSRMVHRPSPFGGRGRALRTPRTRKIRRPISTAWELQLDRFPAPRRILVAVGSHGYDTVDECGVLLWLRNRAVRSGDRVEIMVHEPYLTFGRDRRGKVRWQRSIADDDDPYFAAERVWMSDPALGRYLASYALGRRIPFQWLPIPSNIPVTHDPGRVADVRRRYAPDGRMLLGHFGTFGWPITSVLEPILIAQASPAGPANDSAYGYRERGIP